MPFSIVGDRSPGASEFASGLSILPCPPFPRTLKSPSKREPGRLSSARWSLTFSPCGDREVLRVLRRGRMTVDALAFTALVLVPAVRVWMAMRSCGMIDARSLPVMREGRRTVMGAPILGGGGRSRARVIVVCTLFLLVFFDLNAVLCWLLPVMCASVGQYRSLIACG